MLFDRIGNAQLDPADIAAAIGIIVLLLLMLPSILDGIGHGRQVRRSIIERHGSKLKNESMRRGRAAKSTERSLRSNWALTPIVGLWPERILKEKRKLLRAAGFLDERAFYVFCLVKTFALLLFVVFVLIRLMELFDSDGAGHAADWLIISSLILFFGINAFLRWMKGRRLKRLMRGLPDALDLLVICAEAGLSLDAGLKRVAEEFVTAVPELAEELLLTSIELNFLPDRRQALANLSQRVDVPAMRGVTSTLIQTEKYGTPLSTALRTLSSEFRETRLLRAEEKAARLPAILTVPMICFILPALFIVLAAPAFIKVAEKFS